MHNKEPTFGSTQPPLNLSTLQMVVKQARATSWKKNQNPLLLKPILYIASDDAQNKPF